MSPRINMSDGEEIIFEDLDEVPSGTELEMYDRVILQMLQRVENAFFGDSFFVNFAGASAITINAGLGFQTDGTQSDPEPQKRPIYSDALQPFALAAPDLSNPRIDRICVKSDRKVTATDTRRFKDAITLVVSNQTFDTETDWTNDIQIVTGTPAGSPVAPALPAGYMSLATCMVPAGTGMTGQGDVTDLRVKLPVGENLFLDTTGYTRLPAGSATTLRQIFDALDGLLAGQINAAYDRIVGSVGQVGAGTATDTTLAAAISACPNNGAIKILRGTFTSADVHITKPLTLEGVGRGSVIDANLILDLAAAKSLIQQFRTTGDITLADGIDGVIGDRIWTAPGKQLLMNPDDVSNNDVAVMEET